MTISLLDWIEDDERADEREGASRWPIDLVGEVRRGWPLHPADAETLRGAFATLGFINQSPPPDPPSRDAEVFSAIERFQVAHGIPPDENVTRGSLTILHVNRALELAEQAATAAAQSPRRSATTPAVEGGNPPSFAQLFVARRTRDTARAAEIVPTSAAYARERRQVRAPSALGQDRLARRCLPRSGPTLTTRHRMRR